MTADIETRLRDQLRHDADLVPPSSNTVDSVMAIGRRRRQRARLASGIGCLLLVGGLVAAGGLATRSMSGPADKVVADQPEIVTDGEHSTATTVPGPGVLDIDRADVEPPDTTTPTDRSTSTIPPVASDAGDLPPGLQATPAEAVAGVPVDDILFHSDHEGCATIPDGRGHPDWIEGQPSSDDDRNTDGTRTHGFAYNTGDTTGPEPDIEWGVTEHPVALSGACVIAMTLNHADDQSHAVRLFRRYDRLGRPLPADAYYSVWLHFPEEITHDNRGTIDGEPAFGFWSVFQIKNNVAQPSGDERSLSAASFLVGKLPDENAMSLNVFRKAVCGPVEECDAADSIVQDEPIAIPTERWVHFEVHLVSRPDDTGRIEVWQDGQRIIDFTGQTERPNTERRTWSLNSMGHLHHTPSHTLYADDPVIAVTPIHEHLFD